MLDLVASVEALSEHPIGDAIVPSARPEGIEVASIEDFESHSDHSVEATITGRPSIGRGQPFNGT